MVLSFEKLISDVQGFRDDTELPVTLGSGDSATTERLRLGDIRGQLSNTLARYEAALQTEREQRSALEQTLKTLRDAPSPNSKEESRSAATPTPGSPSDDDLDADPWSRRLYQRALSEVDNRLKSALGDIDKKHTEFADLSKKGVGALTQLLLNLKASQDFNGLKDWPKDYDAARAFKEAGDRGYVDKSTGLPDLSRLHHELTEDQRIDARAKALAEKMYEDRIKAESEKNQSRFNRLGIPTGIRSKQAKKEKKYANLQEYMMSDDALPTDDEVRSAGMLNSLIR